MTIFFIKEGEHESGPFTIEQLRYKFVSKDTLVWHAALNVWVNAGNVYELRELFDPHGVKSSKNKFRKNRPANFFRPPFK
ncbi:MAG TPA: DUF4339 domain-containing protein [Chitinophagaceae bacterium]|nr:DUF4339 domain-containing protein [Chitinophagaceae bacterium]